MESINLLGALNAENDLDVFATQFFAVVDATQIEERESSNYVDGRYFRGRVADVSFKVSWADLAGNEDLPFWIRIESDVPDSAILASMIDELIRSKAMLAGFHFARMLNYGTRNESRFDY